ncbi:MAG: endonuclease MutS2, partial [Chloroflexi bacterium]|nr:endonuclease MutS2 [Chloroflexota bacterium]
MNPKYFRTLELDKILARLAAQCAFAASAELASDLTPSVDADDIARAQAETTEARALLDQHSEMSIGGAREVRPLARNARIGALLAPPEFLEIRQTLFAARALRRALGKLGLSFPRLAARAALLPELPAVADAIARAINERGEVADNA